MIASKWSSGLQQQRSSNNIYLLFYFLFLFYGFKTALSSRKPSSTGIRRRWDWSTALSSGATSWRKSRGGTSPPGWQRTGRRPSTWSTTDTAQPLGWLMKQYDLSLSLYVYIYNYDGLLNSWCDSLSSLLLKKKKKKNESVRRRKWSRGYRNKPNQTRPQCKK